MNKTFQFAATIYVKKSLSNRGQHVLTGVTIGLGILAIAISLLLANPVSGGLLFLLFVLVLSFISRRGKTVSKAVLATIIENGPTFEIRIPGGYREHGADQDFLLKFNEADIKNFEYFVDKKRLTIKFDGAIETTPVNGKTSLKYVRDYTQELFVENNVVSILQSKFSLPISVMDENTNGMN